MSLEAKAYRQFLIRATVITVIILTFVLMAK